LLAGNSNEAAAHAATWTNAATFTPRNRRPDTRNDCAVK
jgi:hypothetical protein